MKAENKLDFWMRCSILSGQFFGGTDHRLVPLATGKECVLTCVVMNGEGEDINTVLERKGQKQS